MEHFKPAFDFLISEVRRTGSFYMTIFALILYHFVFDEHLKCLCKYGVKPEVTYNHCNGYMGFPFLILFLLSLWMDGQFQRVLRITCRCKCNLWGRLLSSLIKAAAVGLQWVVSVLIDGDWYVCYKRAMLPCRNNTTPSQKEEETQLETGFKRESMVYGLVLVLVLIVVNSILTAIPWRDICCSLYAILRYCCCLCILKIHTKENITCCTTSECANCCMMNCKIKPHHRELFEENIREQTEILIDEYLMRTAKECVDLKSRVLQPSLTAEPPTPTTHGGDRPTSTTSTTQGGGRPASTTSTTQGGDRACSSSTRHEVEDRVITIDNLDLDCISDLDSRIISSLFPEVYNQCNLD